MIEVIENIRYNERAGFEPCPDLMLFGLIAYSGSGKVQKITGYRKEEKEWKMRK